MLHPFISLLRNIISLVNLALIVWIILNLLLHFDIINRSNPLVSRIYNSLSRLMEPMLGRIRRVTSKFLPDLGGLDLSPIILWLLLNFIDTALVDWFYNIHPLVVSANSLVR